MASRATTYWRSMLSRLVGGKRFSSTATLSKDMVHNPSIPSFLSRLSIDGDFMPVYVAFGMIMLSLSLGAVAAKQQLLYAPNVFVSKKRREMVPEVYDPDYVVEEAEKFLTKSFFRRVAHIQEIHDQDVMFDPIRGDAFKSEKHVETLKSVGIDPSKVAPIKH